MGATESMSHAPELPPYFSVSTELGIRPNCGAALSSLICIEYEKADTTVGEFVA